jgi:hypothetical protein
MTSGPIPADPPRWLSGTIGGSRALIPTEAGLDRIIDALLRDSTKREHRIRRLCEAGYTVDQAAAVYDLIVELACDWTDENT